MKIRPRLAKNRKTRSPVAVEIASKVLRLQRNSQASVIRNYRILGITIGVFLLRIRGLKVGTKNNQSCDKRMITTYVIHMCFPKTFIFSHGIFEHVFDKNFRVNFCRNVSMFDANIFCFPTLPW